MQGCILQDYEQFQQAAAVFEEAANLADEGTEEDAEIRVSWSECLLRLGRYAEALDALQPAGDSANVLLCRAEAHYYLRQFDKARELVETVLPLKPDDVDVITVAVRVFEQARDYDRGIDLVQAALEREPMNIRLLSSAADVYGAAGQLDDAQQFREKAAATGRLQHRFSQLHQEAIKDVNNALLRLELGQLAEQLGKLQIAQTWYEAAFGMAPDNQEVQNEWERFQKAHAATLSNRNATTSPRP